MMGKREWMFPDAELPPMGSNPEMFGHESIGEITMRPWKFACIGRIESRLRSRRLKSRPDVCDVCG